MKIQIDRHMIWDFPPGGVRLAQGGEGEEKVGGQDFG